jgi:hypothetical protein
MNSKYVRKNKSLIEERHTSYSLLFREKKKRHSTWKKIHRTRRGEL